MAMAKGQGGSQLVPMNEDEMESSAQCRAKITRYGLIYLAISDLSSSTHPRRPP